MNFENHRSVASNALAEFVTLVEQVKQELGVEITTLKDCNEDILELREIMSNQNASLN